MTTTPLPHERPAGLTIHALAWPWRVACGSSASNSLNKLLAFATRVAKHSVPPRASPSIPGCFCKHWTLLKWVKDALFNIPGWRTFSPSACCSKYSSFPPATEPSFPSFCDAITAADSQSVNTAVHSRFPNVTEMSDACWPQQRS